MRPAWCALSLVMSLVSFAVPAAGDAPYDAVFLISKSENRNQVHYALHLDDRCAPVGPSPVQPYWRMLERGAHETEPLLKREVPAYGIREQSVIDRGERGGVVQVVLRALPSRPLLVTSFARRDGCGATAFMVIDGSPATLSSIHVQLRWPFGVDYLLVRGRGLGDGQHPVTERIAP